MSAPRRPYRDRWYKRVGFWLALAPVMHAPRRLRYRIADGLAWVLGRVVKYRRGVIDGNLALAFPERTAAERTAIREDFYRGFADLIVEQVWAFGASEAEVLAMFEVPPALSAAFERHRAAGRPVMVAAGHHNNYELGAAAVALSIPQPMSVIYSPLANKLFDHRLRESRERFGSVLWPRGHVAELMEEWRGRYGSFAVGFAFDQSPHAARRKYWMPFLGQTTAVHPGIDRYARQLGAAVVFVSAERVGRGRYRLHFAGVCDDASALPVGEAVRRATALMEAAIRRAPGGWFWSHRRWKLKIERNWVEGDQRVGVGGGLRPGAPD